MGTFQPYYYKQVLVVRKDLKMRTGKIAAQCAHASMKALLENQNDERVQKWLENSFTKICAYVNSEEELLEIEAKANEARLITSMIVDQGRTEFNGILTRTVLAIGPDLIENIDAITEDLNLL